MRACGARGAAPRARALNAARLDESPPPGWKHLISALLEPAVRPGCEAAVRPGWRVQYGRVLGLAVRISSLP